MLILATPVDKGGINCTSSCCFGSEKEKHIVMRQLFFKQRCLQYAEQLVNISVCGFVRWITNITMLKQRKLCFSDVTFIYQGCIWSNSLQIQLLSNSNFCCAKARVTNILLQWYVLKLLHKSETQFGIKLNVKCYVISQLFCICCHTTRLQSSFFPQAMRRLTSSSALCHKKIALIIKI